MQFIPYLGFSGNCREAFEHYAAALRGTIAALFTHADTPAGEHVPPEQRDRIMHARLVLGDQVLMGFDAHPEMPYDGIKGCDVAVQVETPAEAERLFAALSEGGTVQMPLGETFWSARFGMLTDKFGVPWMINCEKAPAA